MECKSLYFRMFEQINEWKSMCILKKLNLRNEFTLWYPGNGIKNKHNRKEKYSYLLYLFYPMLLYDTLYDALTDRKPLNK